MKGISPNRYQKQSRVFAFAVFLSIIGSFAQAHAAFEACQDRFAQSNWYDTIENCLAFIQSSDVTEKKQLDAFNHVSLSYKHMENSTNEKAYYNKLIGHPLYLNSLENQHDIHRKRGLHFLHRRSLVLAEAEFNKTMDVAVQMANIEWINMANNDLGLLYKKKRNYSKALEYYQKAYEMELKLGRKLYIGITLYNIASVLLHLEKQQEAIKYFQRSIHELTAYHQQSTVEEKKRVKPILVHAYENMVILNMQLNQPDKAELYLNKIIESFSLEKDKKEKMGGVLTVAKYYIHNGKLQFAHTLLKQTFESDLHTGTPYYLDVIWNLAHVQQLLNMHDGSIQHARRGLSEAQIAQDVEYISKFNDLLSGLVENNDPRMALRYLKAHVQNREVFLQQKHDTKIDALEFRIKSISIENELSVFRNWLFGVCLLLFLILNFLFFYMTKKRTEKAALVESIHYHKQQLLLLKNGQESRLKIDSVDRRQKLQEALVKTMIDAIEVWFRYTGKTKIDLADKSKAWKISNDNGNLRTRSLDKYLSIDQIPQNPRWRNVIRTCHFILSNDDLNSDDRLLLDQNIRIVMNILKEDSSL